MSWLDFHFRHFVGAILCLALVPGCSHDVSEKTFDEMADSDALVEVGGNRLTKKDVIEKLQLTYDAAMKKPGANRNGAMRIVQREQARIVDRFIDRKLLCTVSESQQLVSKEELGRIVASNVASVVAARKSTVADYRRDHAVDFRHMEAAFREQALINAYIASNVMPQVNVTGELVTNYLKTVGHENEIVALTNSIKRAHLVEVVKNCNLDHTAWDRLAMETDGDAEGPEEFHFGDFPTAEISEAVFGAKEGVVLGPFEDEECFRLVKVVSSRPGEDHSETGRVCVCSQVLYTKETSFQLWDFNTTKHELTSQLAQQKLQETIACLRTNGTIRICYPNGRNFWAVKKQKQKK